MGEIDLSLYEKTIHSQDGEDGITFKLFELFGTTNKYYVEFGAEWGNCQNNTFALRRYKGFSGLLMDCGYSNPSINLHKHFVTKDNVIELFEKYNVPKKFDLLSLDIDGHDFYALNEILKKYTPRIMICEYNACHPPEDDKVVLETEKEFYLKDNDGNSYMTDYFGGTLLAFYKLGKFYNYSLVYSTKLGVNCFFIHNDLLKNTNIKIKNINDVNKIFNPARYRHGPGNHIYGMTKDPLKRKYITSNDII